MRALEQPHRDPARITSIGTRHWATIPLIKGNWYQSPTAGAALACRRATIRFVTASETIAALQAVLAAEREARQRAGANGREFSDQTR